jgi:hypothetical protein
MSTIQCDGTCCPLAQAQAHSDRVGCRDPNAAVHVPPSRDKAEGSHSIYVSQPKAVADLIVKAATAVAMASR